MGQAAPCCDVSKVNGLERNSGFSGARSSKERVDYDYLNPEEAERRELQLDLDLRMLKDENFRIREEHLRLRRDLHALNQSRATHTPSSAESRVDLEQQLRFMRESIRGLQGENARLRGVVSGEQPEPTEDEHRQLQRDVARLQQIHLQQLEDVRQLKANQAGHMLLGTQTPDGWQARSRASSFCGSFTQSSSFYPTNSPTNGGGSGQVLNQLQVYLQALSQEHEALRSKVRRLASAR